MVEQRSIVTVTTDFGSADGYAGVVKGVILSIAPAATIVDLSHDVGRWDIAAAAWILATSYRYFPADTVHLGVVDPAVGTARRKVIVKAGHGVFVGPDNGIFSQVLAREKEHSAFELSEKRFWLADPSSTFHGRDIFAPVAAYYLNGVEPAALGTEIDPATLVRLPESALIASGNTIEGRVVYVDHFGNLVTNIAGAQVRAGASFTLAGRQLGMLAHTYESAGSGSPVALLGSHGFVEIAVNRGKASELLEAGVGTVVQLDWER